MKRWSVLVFLCVVAVLLVCANLQAAEPGVKSWASGQATIGDASQVSAGVAPEKGERLGLLQLRRMGLTIRNVGPIVKQLIAEGQVSADDSPSVIAAAVMGEMAKSQAWAEEAKSGKVDWDAILAFLEKLIPLILKFV